MLPSLTNYVKQHIKQSIVRYRMCLELITYMLKNNWTILDVVLLNKRDDRGEYSRNNYLRMDYKIGLRLHELFQRQIIFNLKLPEQM